MTESEPGTGPGDVVVLKFGGAAFAAPRAHHTIARHVADRLRADRSVSPGGAPTRAIVVVSAVAGETDRLGSALRAVSPEPDRDLLAAALMTGETVNVALMTAALRDAGLAAVPVTAAETGFVGAGEPHSADLRSIDASVLARLVEPAGTVLVVPGGQAVDGDGRPIMLGRNSSDLSAIAAAIAVGAPACEIFSDSPGICTADPRLVPGARTLATVGYDTMITMSRHGAKVLHHSAVAWAQRHSVEIRCRSLLPDGRVYSVVRAGRTSAAAVLVHGTGTVWAGEPELVQSTQAELADQGSDAVAVPDTIEVAKTAATVATGAGIGSAGGPVAHLVLADATRDLRPRGLRHRADLRLVTTLFPDGRLHHRLVPTAEAPAVARAEHDLVVPA
ncbi:hypothetical protein ND748_09590 [Frankia sp. AiPs1]|uniref:amino acid kinase family protein n=1 Tax=Frankia sp. AiPs1 TaxID=573493 RepID=UPI002042D27A|nr:hypothetical protein [Frankia sp. AiPs1]MCM3921909.1 hypothetical protein [Frankia sp. AiPs1]